MRLKLLIVFIFSILIFGCSKDFVGNCETGGGTETVIGNIIDSSGSSVEGMIVKLLPLDYNPIDTHGIMQIYVDTTDINGQYAFSNIVTDTYNLFAYKESSGFALAKSMLSLDNLSYYNFNDSLEQTGSIKIILPDTTRTASRKVYIPGTDIVASLDSVTLIDSSYMRLIINNVAPTVYSGIYVTTNEKDNYERIYNELKVLPGDTTVISAYLKWSVLNTENSKLPCNVVFAMAIDNEGRHWYATDAGVATLEDGHWQFYHTLNSGLPSNFVYTIAIAKDGSKWFGTSNGLACFKSGKWKVYKETDSELPNNIVHKVLMGENGSVIIGTNNGAAILDTNQNWSAFTTGNSDLPHNEVYCLAEDDYGTIWFGTDGGGVALYKEGLWEIYNTTNSDLRSDYIFEIKKDKSGKMLIGSNGFLAFVENDNWEIIDIEEPSGLNLTISEITQESDSTYWLGSYHKGNVIRYEYGNKMTFYSNANTKMSPYVDMITDIVIDENGTKWISTCSGGVYAISLIE